MAELREKSGSLALLTGAAAFVAFETLAYYGLRWLTAGLRSPDPYGAENSVAGLWVRGAVWLGLHLALVVGALLVLSNRLPRRYRGQLMGWFYLSLLAGFVLLAL